MDEFFRFSCPVCRKKLKAKPEDSGKKAHCSCGCALVVPAASTTRRGNRLVPNTRPRLLWPWFAGAAGSLLLVGLVFWLLTSSSGRQPPRTQVADAAPAKSPVTPSGPATTAGEQPERSEGPEKPITPELQRPKELTPDAATLLAKGGKFWSAPKEYRVGTAAGVPVFLTPGNGLWIWPAEDRAHNKDSGPQDLLFYWQLRSGQKPPSGKFAPQGKLWYRVRGSRTQTTFMALKLDDGPDQGTLRFTHEFREIDGDEAVFWIETDPDGKSNLLVLKVGAPVSAKDSLGSRRIPNAVLRLEAKSATSHAFTLGGHKVWTHVPTFGVTVLDRSRVPVSANDLWIWCVYVSGSPSAQEIAETMLTKLAWEQEPKGGSSKFVFNVDNTSRLVDKIKYRHARVEILDRVPENVRKAAGKDPLAYSLLLAPDDVGKRWKAPGISEVTIPVYGTDIDRVADALVSKERPPATEARGVLVACMCVWEREKLVILSQPIAIQLDASMKMRPIVIDNDPR